MERLSIEIIGGLVGSMADVVALIPAIIVGLIARTWRSRAIASAVVLALVLLIKIPEIQEIARVLDRPEPSLVRTAALYGAGIAIVVSLVAGVRWLLSR